MPPTSSRDPARELYRSTIAEPYRVKVVEKLTLPDRGERERILARAHYSPVYLPSPDVYVDMITDSGTAAMSDAQWAALMRGDEAYMGSRSYSAFEAAVREVTGYAEVVPTHQGRAAENILLELLVQPGDIVLSNTHFDTTRAHVQARGATPVDTIGEWLWNFREPLPFKGNFDVQLVERALQTHGSKVRLIIGTVLNNFACSSPVSLENLKRVRTLAAQHGAKLFLDAARFAENAYFIQQREPGYSNRSIADIVREMFSLADGCWVSAKKDAMVNIGGFIATNDAALADRCRERLVLYEGFPTYGGLARRDLEAIAVGLREAVDPDYLAHRIASVAYLGDGMRRAGALVSLPVGGSGVFVDVEAMYPQLPAERLPGIALCADFYLEGGIRVGAAPFAMHTVDPDSGAIRDRVFQFARFAVPRRVLSKAQLDYVIEITRRVVTVAKQSRGYRTVHQPEVLGHFFARFAPVET
ncbi:MAG: tryptophanase [Polyangiaceae bacterium]